MPGMPQGSESATEPMTVARYHDSARRDTVKLTTRLFPHIPERFLDGKHLRGTLLLLVSDSLGGNREKALPLAAAVDLVHQATLEHDNVLDRHADRRGKPTTYALEGPGKAILSGDWLLSLAFGLPRTAGQTAEMAGAARDVFQWASYELDTPQRWQELAHEAGQPFYPRLNQMKTGSLFRVSSRLGALSSGAGRRTVDTFGRYGLSLGEAFQLADDIGDYVRLQEGDSTQPIDLQSLLPMLLHYGARPEEDRLTAPAVVRLARKVDLEARVRQDMEDRLRECTAIASSLPVSPRHRALLTSFPEYAVGEMIPG